MVDTKTTANNEHNIWTESNRKDFQMSSISSGLEISSLYMTLAMIGTRMTVKKLLTTYWYTGFAYLILTEGETSDDVRGILLSLSEAREREREIERKS